MAESTVADMSVANTAAADMAMSMAPAQPRSRLGRRMKAARAQFRRSLPLSVGTATTLVVVILSIAAPYISPYDPITPDLANSLQPPSAKYILGTDDLGRDMLTRALWGGRIALPLAITAVLWSSIVGILLGLISGYSGRWVDSFLMRIMDAQLALPGILLALGITAALGPSISTLILAIGISRHSLVGAPREVTGTRHQRARVRHRRARYRGQATADRPEPCVPGTTSNIIVALSLRAPAAITAEAGLSFLGLGVPPPVPTWGSMIAPANAISSTHHG